MTHYKIQCLLAFLGYYPLPPDNTWGAGSVRACKAFQQAHGLEQDGIPGKLTQEALQQAIRDSFDGKTAEPSTDEPTGTFWDEIKYFNRTEFACPCKRCWGFPVEPSEKLVRIADSVRAHFGAPITVSSGVRCQIHNDELSGSVPNSRHVQGKAMDFCVRGRSADTVLAHVKAIPGIRYAYKIDNSYVHMDVE